MKARRKNETPPLGETDIRDAYGLYDQVQGVILQLYRFKPCADADCRFVNTTTPDRFRVLATIARPGQELHSKALWP